MNEQQTTEQVTTQVNSSPMPNSNLKALNRLVGTWEFSGGAEGASFNFFLSLLEQTLR